MFPRNPQPRPDQTVLTGSVKPELTPEAVALFRSDIGNDLTLAEQHEAVRKAVEIRLSDAAIAARATPSIEANFNLGTEDQLDPNLWGRLDESATTGEEAVVAAERLQVEEIRLFAERAGAALVDQRNKRAAV